MGVFNINFTGLLKIFAGKKMATRSSAGRLLPHASKLFRNQFTTTTPSASLPMGNNKLYSTEGKKKWEFTKASCYAILIFIICHPYV